MCLFQTGLLLIKLHYTDRQPTKCIAIEYEILSTLETCKIKVGVRSVLHVRRGPHSLHFFTNFLRVALGLVLCRPPPPRPSLICRLAARLVISFSLKGELPLT